MQAVKDNVTRNVLRNRDFLLCMAVSFFSTTAYGMVNPVLSVFGKSIGISEETIGTYGMTATFICMFARGISGKLADIIRKKSIIRSGMILCMAGFAMYCGSRSSGSFLAAQILQKTGSGVIITTMSVFSVCVVPEKEMTAAIGIYALASSIANCFAPHIGTTLAYSQNFLGAFLLAMVLLGTALVFLLCIREPAASGRKKEPAGKRAGIRNILYLPAVPAGILMMFAGIIYTTISSFLSLYGIERNFAHVGAFYTINAVSMMVTRPLVVRLCERRSLAFSIVPGYLFEMAACILLAAAPSEAFVWPAGVCYGIGYGMSMCASQILALQSAPPEHRGDANGTYYVFGDVGLALGYLAAGKLIAAFGYTVLFLVMAGTSAASILFYILYLAWTRLGHTKRQGAENHVIRTDTQQ